MSERNPVASTPTTEPARGRLKQWGSQFSTWLKNSQNSSPYTYQVLPESVRYAMFNRGARLTSREIETLYRAGLTRPAFYLAMKAAEAHSYAQTEMLSRLALRGFNYGKLELADIQVGTALLDSADGEKRGTVCGEKLGQFSRHGFMGDVDRFDTVLGQTTAEHPESDIYMVANYPYIAMDVLAKHSLERGRRLGIINPDHITQGNSPIGFKMEGMSPDISIDTYGRESQLSGRVVFFDDVLRLGKTRGVVMSWAEQQAPEAIFVTAERVSGEVLI